MAIVLSARSHKGRLRSSNEDNLFIDGVLMSPELRTRPFSIDVSASMPVVLAVCDGMGGEKQGELASWIAANKLTEFSELIKRNTQKELNKTVQKYAEAANSEITSHSKRSGTTLALAVITKKGTRCFNVGDSRIYCYKSGLLTQVTNDHTIGAEMVRDGIIAIERSRLVENGSKLTRCVGIGHCFRVCSHKGVDKQIKIW